MLKNFQRFLNSAEIVQALQHQLQDGKLTKKFIVILAPTIQLPVELERQFVILEHDLPDREQLGIIARETVADRPQDVPTGRNCDSLLDASKNGKTLLRHTSWRKGISHAEHCSSSGTWAAIVTGREHG